MTKVTQKQQLKLSRLLYAWKENYNSLTGNNIQDDAEALSIIGKSMENLYCDSLQDIEKRIMNVLNPISLDHISIGVSVDDSMSECQLQIANEFVFRHNLRKDDRTNLFHELLQNANQRLTYKNLVGV